MVKYSQNGYRDSLSFRSHHIRILAITEVLKPAHFNPNFLN